MKSGEPWAIGVDLGGTKVEIAAVDRRGHLLNQIRCPTHVEAGPHALIADISKGVRNVMADVGSMPVGVGVGLAGQIDPNDGLVRFAPNLGWRDVPFQKDLGEILRLPVVVTNDVRAAAWGEWLHGAGKGSDDLICLFVGTGIGGGVVSSGRMLTGCTNTAGELGHMTIDLNGPTCTCGSQGCFEALAGGWAIARQAKEAVSADTKAGAFLLHMAGGTLEGLTAKVVAEADRSGDPLAGKLVDQVARALTAGAASLVNAFNPCRLILGGGVIEGLPELIERTGDGVRERALAAATESLEVLPAKLGNDAGVIGAATLAIRKLGKNHQD